MSDLVPRPANLPAATGKPSFTRLAARMATLTASALALKEGLWALKRRMETDADHADMLADLCVAAEVEPRFTGQINEAGTSPPTRTTASDGSRPGRGKRGPGAGLQGGRVPPTARRPLPEWSGSGLRSALRGGSRRTRQKNSSRSW